MFDIQGIVGAPTRRGGTAGRLCVVALIGAGLTGCGSQVPAPIDFRGTDPEATATSPTPSPNDQGVVRIDNYDAVMAREGDTIESIAARLGISASELAAYNGYPAGFTPRDGDILVLPPRPGGYGAARSTQVAAATPAAAAYPAPSATERWSPAIAAAAIERAGEPADANGAATGVPDATDPMAEAAPDGSDSLFAPLAEPLEPPTQTAAAPSAGVARYRPTGNERTHIAASGDTMFSIANLYTVTVGELAYANGMAASDPISPGQVLIIPTFAGFSAPAGAAPVGAAAAAGQTDPDEVVIGEPSGAPVDVAAAQPASEPAPVDSGARFLSPVSGKIIEAYTPKGGGIEMGAAPGAPVRAAEDGVVVLVSKSLGGLGTIILVRHSQEYMTVYGRVKSDRLVEKGQKVKRGQTIATVAEPTAGREPSLHFEIRRGTESVDPEPLI